MKKIKIVLLIIFFSASAVYSGIIKFGMMGLAEDTVEKLGPSAIEDLDFKGFTHGPVDFEVLFDTSVTGKSIYAPPITPYFNYSNTSHAEGPRKWYIYGTTNVVMKVYTPCKTVLKQDGINFQHGQETEYYNGEKIWVNVQVWLQASEDIEVFFMHLSLRDKIKSEVENASQGYKVYEAGTHIGYIYYPTWNSLDFGVEDRTKDSGMSPDPYYWWNIRANPYDYFNSYLKNKILELYQPMYDKMKTDGETPYSDLTDSRSNINVNKKIWGVWFRDDLSNPLEEYDTDWSIINTVKKEYLHEETYHKTLDDYPEMDGLYAENTSGEIEEPHLYPIDDSTLGICKFFIEIEDSKGKGAKIVKNYNDSEYRYLRYKVEVNDPDTIYDDKLIIKGFKTKSDAEDCDLSSDVITFRRTPQ
ncbi:MAG: hypothetical protein ACOC5R_01495 [Elusimicrobiota bacterium]